MLAVGSTAGPYRVRRRRREDELPERRLQRCRASWPQCRRGAPTRPRRPTAPEKRFRCWRQRLQQRRDGRRCHCDGPRKVRWRGGSRACGRAWTTNDPGATSTRTNLSGKQNSTAQRRTQPGASAPYRIGRPRNTARSATYRRPSGAGLWQRTQRRKPKPLREAERRTPRCSR